MYFSVAALVIVAIVAVVMVNSLISLRNLVKNAWADVDIYLKRRAELIPNLVTTVSRYADHEKEAFERLAEARTRAMSAHGTAERGSAESEVSGAVGRALMVAEAYPELKASENFLALQRELSETESKIASARQYFNACVRDHNIKVESFPSNLAASLLGMKPQPFFEIVEPTDRDVPVVSIHDPKA